MIGRVPFAHARRRLPVFEICTSASALPFATATGSTPYAANGLAEIGRHIDMNGPTGQPAKRRG